MNERTAALFAAVYADPSDDQARAVLADHLQEIGDVRGAFISLSSAAGGDPARTRRLRTLLDAHRAQLLGPLAPVVHPVHHRFSRGFLAEAIVDLEGFAVPRTDAWATLERLDLRGTHGHPATFLLENPFPVLESVAGLDPATFASLATRPPAFPRLSAVGLHGFVDDRETRAAVLAGVRLPTLRDLRLVQNRFPWTVGDFAWLHQDPSVRRLRRLEVELLQPVDLAGWMAVTEDASFDELAISTQYFCFELSRGSDGRRSALRVVWRGVSNAARALVGVTTPLRALPVDALTSFELVLGSARFSANQLAPLRKTVARQTTLPARKR